MSSDFDWKEVGMEALTTALSSGATTPVAPELLPDWIDDMPGFTGAWLYYGGGAPALSTESLSTLDAQASMDVERRDGELLKFYRYYYMLMEDGRVFQFGPVKDMEYGHHLKEQPDWIAEYSSNSSRPKS